MGISHGHKPILPSLYALANGHNYARKLFCLRLTAITSKLVSQSIVLETLESKKTKPSSLNLKCRRSGVNSFLSCCLQLLIKTLALAKKFPIKPTCLVINCKQMNSARLCFCVCFGLYTLPMAFGTWILAKITFPVISMASSKPMFSKARPCKEQ